MFLAGTALHTLSKNLIIWVHVKQITRNFDMIWIFLIHLNSKRIFLNPLIDLKVMVIYCEVWKQVHFATGQSYPGEGLFATGLTRLVSIHLWHVQDSSERHCDSHQFSDCHISHFGYIADLSYMDDVCSDLYCSIMQWWSV